jgi:uncharacterized protein Yka (UPF0111/DUF47 family)
MDNLNEMLLIEVKYLIAWNDALIEGDMEKACEYRKKIDAIEYEIEGLRHELDNLVMAYDPTF